MASNRRIKTIFIMELSHGIVVYLVWTVEHFGNINCFSGRVAEVFAFVVILTLFLLDLWLNSECTYMGNITGYLTMWEWNSNVLSVICSGIIMF